MFALASFVAAVCLTLFAPFVHPVVYERICTAGGNKFVASDSVTGDADRHSSHGDHAAHCPLCMPAGAPPVAVALEATPVQPLAYARRGIPSARLASLVGAPLPARGPPLFS